jgi:hypothetical protein
VYPSRLCVNDPAAFARSMDVVRTRPVRYVMGCHVEMRRASGRD